MLKLNVNLMVATEVLNAVNNLLCSKRIEAEDFWVEAYSNGREQGYCIRSIDLCIAFSEYRSSDSIVVYHSNEGSFSMQGNVPNEKAWINAKFFNCGDFDSAAKHIVNLLEWE